MPVETLTLTDFLLARIAEDEEAGTAGEQWDLSIGGQHDVAVQFWDYGETHIGYRRFLAECEAKRRIVNMMDNLLQSFSAQNGGPGRGLWHDVNRREQHHANEVLANLALPYAEHPDFREEWRP